MARGKLTELTTIKSEWVAAQDDKARRKILDRVEIEKLKLIVRTESGNVTYQSAVQSYLENYETENSKSSNLIIAIVTGLIVAFVAAALKL